MKRVESRVRELFQVFVEGTVYANIIPDTDNGTGPTKIAVDVRFGKYTQALEVIWAGEGWPKDVRFAAGNVPTPWPRDVVIAAKEFSPGALKWLRERDANWLDETGRTRILGASLPFNVKAGSHDEMGYSVKPDAEEAEFSWYPSATTVAEYLLTHPGSVPRIDDLSALTEWSTQQLSKVLIGFDNQGWTAKQGPSRGPQARREVVDPDGLLRSWGAHVSSTAPNRRLGHCLMENPIEFLKGNLANALSSATSWAVTGWAGVELTAPYLTSVPTLQIYIDHDDFGHTLTRVMSELGIREVDEGARIEFWDAERGELTLASKGDVPNVPVVSPPRLFADLKSLGTRGMEAAEHIKEEMIDA